MILTMQIAQKSIVSADLSKYCDRVNQDVMKTKNGNCVSNIPFIKITTIFPEVGTVFQRYKYAVDYDQIRISLLIQHNNAVHSSYQWVIQKNIK